MNLVATLVLAALSLTPAHARPPVPNTPAPVTSTVSNVYDGDTFTLATGDRVRLRLVNTPELKPAEAYGIEAREATKAFLSGKPVQLAYGATQRDGYGRLLAAVKVGSDLLAVHLLERGLGHLFVIPPDETDMTPYLEAQERARAGKRGIWSTPEFQGSLHITSFHANADGDDRSNVNGEYLRVCNISSGPVQLAGFRIADISGASWDFPELIVPPGHTIKVHSGQGVHQLDPTEQLAIYLGSSDPIWNNKDDRATIYDRYGKVVDTRTHSVQKEGR